MANAYFEPPKNIHTCIETYIWHFMHVSVAKFPPSWLKLDTNLARKAKNVKQ
jgi:hypothetical protein